MRGRDRWSAFERPYAPRLAVEGGVRVPRPGTVSGEAATALVRAAVTRTTSGVASRGRTYARAGQVVELRLGTGQASAAVQGSDAAPYSVALVRDAAGEVEAECTCPYGCDALEWCKHAAALAYVLADLVDRDPALLGRWLGEAETAAGGRERQGEGGTARGAISAQELGALVSALRSGAAPAVDGAAQWAAALHVLPLPPGLARRPSADPG